MCTSVTQPTLISKPTSRGISTTADALRDTLTPLSANAQTVLVLGHNPGWERAVETFSGKILAMKTGDLVVLTAQSGEWEDLMSRTHMWAYVETIKGRVALNSV